MSRYVFTGSKRYVAAITAIAIVAWLAYAFRGSPTMVATASLMVLLITCAAMREILFMEKELIITNIYGMRFHIQYDEIKCFGKGIGTELTIIALKKKFIPLYFQRDVGSQSEIAEILARLEANTGRTRGVIFESKKSAKSGATTHDDTLELEVTFDGKNDTHVMTRPMLYLTKAVRVLSIAFMVCVVLIFGLSILSNIHQLPHALRSRLDQYHLLLFRILYAIVIPLAVAAVYVKLIRPRIIKQRPKS